MNKLFIILTTLLFISGCGGDDKDTDTANNDSPNTDTTHTENTAPATQRLAAPFISPATVSTETAFTDTYTASNTADIAWKGPATNKEISIDSIAYAFNEARKNDPTVKEALRMPEQATWDAYDTSMKLLYLINSERSARGMRPFRGIAPELETSSSIYASELSDNGAFSHTYGTYPNPTTRLAGWANVKAPPQTALPTGDENTTYNTYYIEELISYETGSPINQPEARAIYRFMYEDSSPEVGGDYAHRKAILIKDPASAVVPSAITVNNAAPLIGASSVNGNNRNTIVVHGIDPNAKWNMMNVKPAPSLIGPEISTDCLSGTFTESKNADGINTSTCQ